MSPHGGLNLQDRQLEVCVGVFLQLWTQQKQFPLLSVFKLFLTLTLSLKHGQEIDWLVLISLSQQKQIGILNYSFKTLTKLKLENSKYILYVLLYSVGPLKYNFLLCFSFFLPFIISAPSEIYFGFGSCFGSFFFLGFYVGLKLWSS